MPRLCVETDRKCVLRLFHSEGSSEGLPGLPGLGAISHDLSGEWEPGRLDEYRGLEFLGLGQRRRDEKMRRREDEEMPGFNENKNENGRNRRNGRNKRRDAFDIL